MSRLPHSHVAPLAPGADRGRTTHPAGAATCRGHRPPPGHQLQSPGGGVSAYRRAQAMPVAQRQATIEPRQSRHHRTVSPARRRWRRLGADRGATSVEMVGYTAVMLAALLVGVQAAVWGLGELACRYAANHALQVTRVQGGSAAAGQADAATVLDDIHGNLVTEPEFSAGRDAATATVRVKGKAVQVIPFLTLPVGTTVSAPTEVLVPVPTTP